MNVRPLRGQVVVREVNPNDPLGDAEAKGRLWTPDIVHGDRGRRIHLGEVIALGAPALVGDTEVTFGFDVGARVYYSFNHLEKLTTRPWPIDGKDATWVPQQSVHAVYEP